MAGGFIRSPSSRGGHHHGPLRQRLYARQLPVRARRSRALRGETHTITVNILGNANVEAPNEDFSITLGAASPGNVAVASADIVSGEIGTGTIINNTTDTLTINSPSVIKAAGMTQMVFTVTSPNAVTGGYTVAFTVANITATGASDYTLGTASPLTFAGVVPGETQTITVNIVGNTTVENPTETFSVTLGAVTPVAPVSAANIFTGEVGVGTIVNNTTSTLSINSPVLAAPAVGTAPLVFTVTSSNAVTGGFTTAFTVADITTGGASDYLVATASPLTFAGGAGETHTITVNVIATALVEGTETFSVTLGAVTPVAPVVAADIITGAAGIGTITDTATDTLTLNNPSVVKPAVATAPMVFTVTSPNAVEGGFTVPFNVADITSTGASDYSLVTASPLTFAGAAGEIQTITVNIVGNTIVEPATEDFSIQLGAATPLGPVTATNIITGEVGTGTIVNNTTDALTIGNQSVVKPAAGSSPMVFTVTSPASVTGGFTVTFSVADITSTGATDYTLVSASPLTFTGAVGEIHTITVNIVGNTTVEPTNEDFSITLGGVAPVAPVAAASIITGAVGTGTIVNTTTDTLTINSPSVVKPAAGNTPMVFTVTSPTVVQGGFTVAFAPTDLTTTLGTDYSVPTPTPLTFAGTANETHTITVSVLGNLTVENPIKEFTMALGTVTPSGTVSPASIITGEVATGTIDSNTTDALTISSPLGVVKPIAASSPIVFTVTSPNAVTGGFTVPFSLADITTTGATDYLLSPFTPSPLTFTGTAGEQHLITVNILGNTTVEPANEDFSVTLGTATTVAPVVPASIVTGAVGTGTIVSNTTDTLTILSQTVAKPSSGSSSMVFTVTSPNGVQGGFTVAFNVTNGTATLGSDYTVGTASPLTFAGTAGETHTITVNILGNTTVENPAKTFSITLGTVTTAVAPNPVPAADIITGEVATGTITSATTDTLTIGSPSVIERRAGVDAVDGLHGHLGELRHGRLHAPLRRGRRHRGPGQRLHAEHSQSADLHGRQSRRDATDHGQHPRRQCDGRSRQQDLSRSRSGAATPVAPVPAASIVITGEVGTGTILNATTEETLSINSPSVIKPRQRRHDADVLHGHLAEHRARRLYASLSSVADITDDQARSIMSQVITASPLTRSRASSAGETQIDHRSTSSATRRSKRDRKPSPVTLGTPVTPGRCGRPAASIVAGEVGTGHDP